MFQAKTTRIALALALTLALTSASSAVALSRDQPLGSGVVAERAPVAWVSLFLSLLTKAGGRMDGNGQKAGGRMDGNGLKAGGRMDGNGLKAGGRMDGNGLSQRVAACIDDESDPQCEDGGR